VADAPAAFLDPALLARLADLALLARTVVDGVLHGAHRSRRTGASLDFAEHRAYQPGDDLRRVDWRLVGRTDRYFVKEFEADTTTQLLVALDCSGSMDFGSHAVDKFAYARMLAACLAWLAHAQGDRVGVATCTDRLQEVVPPAARQRLAVLQALGRARAGGRGGMAAALAALGPLLRRPGMVALVTDAYDDPEALGRGVDALRVRGHDVMVFHVVDPAERELPGDDAATFEDAEEGTLLSLDPAEWRDRYRALVAGHHDAVRRRLAAAGADHLALDTRAPLDRALHAWLRARPRRLAAR
jgi:uncharacterized protein (DUF58 family)